MTDRKTWKPLTLAAACAASLAAGAAGTTFAQDAAETPAPAASPEKPGRGDGRRFGPRWERGGWKERARAAAARRRGRHDLVKSLELSDDQRRVALEKARAAQPIVDAWRRKVAEHRVAERAAADGRTTDGAAAEPTKEERRTRRDARRADRTRLREELATALAPLARDVVAALTPEQRARIEGFAAARGRNLDEAALVRGVSRMLVRPMTVPMLEARLAR